MAVRARLSRADIKIGSTYLARVGTQIMAVRIEAEPSEGVWDSLILKTGNRVVFVLRDLLAVARGYSRHRKKEHVEQ